MKLLLKACMVITIVLMPFILIQAQDTEDIDRGLVEMMDNIIPPSPTASSLGKYADHPVNTFTGIPKIEIPLFTISSGNISIPISLSYHASGIKVNDMSSFVGLGWSLNAGGVVSRTVKGAAADEFEPTIYTGFYERDFLGYFHMSSYTWPNELESGTADAEPDEWFYNFNGNAGKFVYDKNQTPHLIPFNNYKITHEIGSVSQISDNSLSFKKFNIKSDNGLLYEFSDYEVTRNYTLKLTYGISGNFKEYVSSIYLSKISEPGSDNEIRFFYNSISELDYESNISYGFFNGIGGCASQIPGTHKSWNDIDIEEAKRINKIEFDNGYLLFEYNFNREDLKGAGGAIIDKALTEIKLFNNDNELIKSFVLDYDHFSSGGTGEKSKRLRLKSVTECDNNGNPSNPYIFTYNSTVLPDRDSPEQDAWGFFNDNNASTHSNPKMYVYPDYGVNAFTVSVRSSYTGSQYIIPGINKASNSSVICAASLEKIEYPTGGYTSFIYEPHQFISPSGQLIIGGGIRVKKTITHDAENSNNDITKEFQYYSGSDPLNSTGLVNNMPQFAFLSAECPANPDYTYFKDGVFYKFTNQAALGSKDGSYVMYSEVKIKSTGNGYEINKYSTPNMTTWTGDVSVNNSYIAHGSDICNPKLSGNLFKYDHYPYMYNMISKTNSWGLLLENTVYDESGSLVKKMTNSYERFEKGIIDISTASVYFMDQNARHFSEGSIYTYSNYKIISDAIKLKESKIENYYSQATTSETTDFFYDNLNHLYQTRSETINSEGDLIKSYTFFPQDYTNSTLFNNLKNNNILNVPIDNRVYVNGYLTKGILLKYNDYGKPIESYVADDELGAALAINTSVSDPYNYGHRNVSISYDNVLNIESFNKEDDINTTYIWGYNYTLPVAKIQNATFAEVTSVLECTVAALQTKTDSELRSIFNNLRNHSNMSDAIVVSYTHIPLVGIGSITNERSQTTYYEYDKFARLESIKNSDGNIKENIEYNYYEAPFLDMSVESRIFSGEGDTFITSISTNVLDFQITNDSESWLTVTQDGNQLTFSAGANQTSSSRSATITFNGEYLTDQLVITQDKISLSANFSNAFEFIGINQSYTIPVTANCSWTVSSESQDWFTYTPSSGSNNGTITISCIKAYSTSRQATLYISNNFGTTLTHVVSFFPEIGDPKGGW